MKNLFSSILLLLLTLFSSAQTDSFLNNYNYRYQQFRGFQLNGSLNNSGSIHLFRDESLLNDSTIVRTNRYLNRSGAINFNPDFFSFTNIPSLQQETSFKLNQNTRSIFFKGESTDNDRRVDREFSNNLDLNVGHIKRMYRKNNTFDFMSVSINHGWDVAKNRNKTADTIRSSYDSKTHRNTLSFSAGFGSGRLEVVSDLIQAYFILDDIEQWSGQKIEDQKAVKLAEGITAIRNKRYLDNRLGYKSQIAALDTLMRACGIEKQVNIDYFLILTDNWLYARRENRSSGKRWTHRFELFNYVWHRKSDQYLDERTSYRNRLNTDINRISSLNLISEFDYSIQKSRYVQWRAGAQFKLGTNQISSKQKFETDEEQFNFERDYSKSDIESNLLLYAGFLYQPNSRNIFNTDINTSLNQLVVMPESLSPDVVDFTRSSLNAAVRVDCRYYHWFSPFFSVNARAQLDAYSNQRQQEIATKILNPSDSNWNYNFTAGFVYRWF